MNSINKNEYLLVEIFYQDASIIKTLEGEDFPSEKTFII